MAEKQSQWWKESVVYQIYPRSFQDSNGDGIGDLNGIRSRLDYLARLGIDVIWLSPVYKSPNDDNGYDISDYQAIMDDFGTMDDFDALLSEAHAKNIKIVMDLVVNHTSDEHPWFIESRSSKNNPKRDFYIWRDAKPDGTPPTNWGSCFSGSAWEFDEKTNQYYLHFFSKKQPDLNWDNPKVRDAVFDMMSWWCDKGIDGFRMDVISMISKPDIYQDSPTHGGLYGDSSITCNGPRVHEYLREMRQRVLSKYNLMTVGETAGVNLEEAKKYANANGTELNMVFQFEHVDLDSGADGKWSKNPMSLIALKSNLSKWQNGLDGVAWNSLFFCNHDQPRVVSRLGDNSPVSAKAIATMLHMMQGTPYIYQGEELGMTNCPFGAIENYRDIETLNAYRELTESKQREPEELLSCIAYKSRDNARTPMQWDNSPNAGFTSGTPWIMTNPNYKTINAAAQINNPDSVFSYYQKLIALRHESDWKNIIIYGHYDLLSPDDPDIFAYTRELDGRKLLIICNFTAKSRRYTIPEEIKWQNYKSVISNINNNTLARELNLNPWEADVWELI